METETSDTLGSALLAALDRPGSDWLQDGLGLAGARYPDAQTAMDALAPVLAAARRALGEGQLVLRLPLQARHRALFGTETFASDGWSLADGARVLLLRRLLDSGRWPVAELIGAAYVYGDEQERCAIARGAYWLAPAGELNPLLVDAKRTNSMALFAAVVLDNPWPAAWFDDAAFNQAVLKALFLDLDIRRVAGLAARHNAELVRMCDDYRQERALAGRPVPESIRLVLEQG